MDEGPSQGAKKRALGRGLGALIGEGSAALARAGTAPGEGRLRDLSLDAIAVSRRQPRRAFDPDELAELAASIKALGVVQPVVVRPLGEAGGAGAPAPPGGARVRADRRRAPPARRAARRPRHRAGPRAPGRRGRGPRDRPGRERRPRGPQRDRGGPGVRVPRRRVRAHARARRRARRTQPCGGDEHAASARASRRGAANDRVRRLERRVTAARSWGSPTTADAAASRSSSASAA